MLGRKGMTLMEILVVVVILGIAAALYFPNYNRPIQQARAATALNNLLAIYSAEQNYYNNNSSYCYSGNGNICISLADINSKLSLNIQDDGSYTYSCGTYGTIPSCQALNSAYSPNPITVFLTGNNGAIHYPLSQNINPYSGDCPGAKCPF